MPQSNTIFIWVIAAILFLIFFILLYKTFLGEKFISYISTYANMSESGNKQWIVLTKYIPNENKYPFIRELGSSTLSLSVMEIFKDKTFKTYNDDGFVREGIFNDKYWQLVQELIKLADKYNKRKFCEIEGKELTHHTIWVEGKTIDLGIFTQNCVPEELFKMKQLFDFMFYSPWRTPEDETYPGLE